MLAKDSTLIIGKPQMRLIVKVLTKMRNCATYQQEETAEGQAEDQRTSQVGVFENALLGRSERVEHRQRLQEKKENFSKLLVMSWGALHVSTTDSSCLLRTELEVILMSVSGANGRMMKTLPDTI